MSRDTRDGCQVLEQILKDAEPDKRAREIEIKLIARLRKHLGNPKFTALGERLEKVKERHEQGFITSLEFLKAMLEIAKEVVEAEKAVDPVEERDRAKEALTELFKEAKGASTPVIVERIVTDIDDIVKKVRFPDWQHTSQGERLVQKELRRTAAEVQAAHGPGAVRQSVRFTSGSTTKPERIAVMPRNEHSRATSMMGPRGEARSRDRK
jgi:hypothetical protein